MTLRPFRFAAAIPQADSGPAFLDAVRRAEAQGYTDCVLFDHFWQSFGPIAGLTAAAMVAPSMRISCTVFDNDFRHPAILAKEMATLDQLSDGRLDVGLGAGWLQHDYDQSGIAYDRPGVRIGRMEESIVIMKGLWRDGPLTFKGEHYAVSEMEGHPKPIQNPLPLLIGGGGKRILSIAAREASIIGIHIRLGPTGSDKDAGDESRRQITEKIDLIRDEAGDRFESIELAMQLFAAKIVGSQAEVTAEAERIASSTGILRFTVTSVLNSPYHLIGSLDDIVEALLDVRQTFRVSHFTILNRDLDGFAPVLARLSGT